MVNQSAVEEFYEIYKEGFHGDFKDLDNIVRGPFRYFKSELTQGTLKPYRLQYFGTFSIPRPRIFHAKKKLTEKLSEGLISESKYSERMELLNRYNEKEHT